MASLTRKRGAKSVEKGAIWILSASAAGRGVRSVLHPGLERSSGSPYWEVRRRGSQGRSVGEDDMGPQIEDSRLPPLHIYSVNTLRMLNINYNDTYATTVSILQF